MFRYILISTISFWKKPTSILLLLISIAALPASYYLIATKSEENLSIFYPKTLIPYFLSSFFVIFVVAYVFRKTTFELLMLTKPISRSKLFVAKILTIILVLSLLQFLLFVLHFISSFSIEKLSTTKALYQATTLSIGGMVVNIAFSSFMVLTALFFNQIGYGIFATVLIFACPSLSIIFQTFSDPNEKDRVKEAKVISGNSKYYISNEEQKIRSYASLAPLDIYKHWNDMYFFGDADLMPQKGPFSPALRKRISSEVLDTTNAKTITVFDSNNDKHTLGYLEIKDTDESSYWSTPQEPNSEQLKIIEGTSVIKDMAYLKLIKDLFESNSLNIIQKLSLVRKFREYGIFTSAIPSNHSPYNYQDAIETLANYGIKYDKNLGEIKYDVSNSIIDLERVELDYSTFEMFSKMIDKDPLIANVKAVNMNEANNLNGLFDIYKPVSGISHFERWIKIEILFTVWIMISISLFTVTGFIFTRKDFKF